MVGYESESKMLGGGECAAAACDSGLQGFVRRCSHVTRSRRAVTRSRGCNAPTSSEIVPPFSLPLSLILLSLSPSIALHNRVKALTLIIVTHFVESLAFETS